MRYKRVLASFLLCILLISKVPTTIVNAVTIRDVDRAKQVVQESVSLQIRDIQSKMFQGPAGIAGTYYNLDLINSYISYLLFVADHGNKLDLGYTNVQISVMYKDFCDYYIRFYTAFEGSLGLCIDDFRANYNSLNNLLNANVDDSYVKDMCRVLEDLYAMIIPVFTRETLQGIYTTITALPEERQRDALTSYNNYLYYLYQMILNYDNVSATLCNYYNTVASVADTERLAEASCFWLSSDGNATFAETLTTLKGKYDKILKHCGEIEAPYRDDAQIDIGDIDNFDSYLLALSNAAFTEDGISTDNNEVPKLSNAFKAIFSCSAVYTPFSSITGCDEFIESLKSLTNSDLAQQEKIIRLYQSLKSYKKPLYKRAIAKDGALEGTANICTIEDFITDIKEGNSIALSAVKGKFMNYSNNGSWYYVPTSTTIRSSDTTLQLVDTTAGLNDSTISNCFLASETINGSDILTDPVLSFSKNVLRQEDNIAYAVLNNIILGSKHINNVQNAGMSFIYVNFFGDIVTQDDIVILPAATNPKYINYKSNAITYYNPYTVAVMNYYPLAITVPSEDSETPDLVFTSNNATGKYVFGMYASTVENKEEQTGVDFHFWTLDFVKDVWQSISAQSSDFLDLAQPYGSKIFERKAIPDDYDMLGVSKMYKVLDGVSSGLFNRVTGNTSVIDASTMFGLDTVFLPFFAFAGSDFKAANDVSYPLLAYQKYNFGIEHTEIETYENVLEYLEEHADGLQGCDFSGAENYIATSGFDRVNTIDGFQIFPYVASSDRETGFKLSSAIAWNFYYCLTNPDIVYNETTNFMQVNESLVNKDWLAESYIFDNVLVSGLGGAVDINSYIKEFASSYQVYVEAQSERFNGLIQDLSYAIIDGTENTESIVGVQALEKDYLFGPCFAFLKENIIFVILLLLLLLALGFLKQKLSIYQLLLKALLSVGVIALIIYVVPSYVPIVINSVVSDLSKNTSYRILCTQSETKKDSVDYYKVDENGKGFINATASINLYRFSQPALAKFLKDYNISEYKINSGKVKVINTKAGTFLEGDCYKITTDALFDSLVLDGELKKEDNGNTVYQVRAIKLDTDNNVDYYCPYYNIATSFTSKLNSLLKVYNIPRSTTYYAGQGPKDSFLVKSYVNSLPFLSPEDYTRAEISLDDQEALTDYELHLWRLQEVFGNNKDWLGLSSFLLNVTPAQQDTLWFKSMQINGYYDEEFNPNMEKLTNLIESVNLKTKEFILDNMQLVASACDETLLELISLYATTVFDTKISNYGNWVYPVNVNYEDFTLDKILTSTIMSDSSNISASYNNLVDYIITEHNWFNLIIFDLDTVLLYGLTKIINVLVPAFFLMLIIFVILRLFIGNGLHEVLAGYLRVMLIVFLIKTILTTVVMVAGNMMDKRSAIYLLCLGGLISLYLLITVFIAVITNFTELGNSKLSAKFSISNFKASAMGFGSHFKNNIKTANDKVNTRYTNRQTAHETREHNKQLLAQSSPKAGFSNYDNDYSIDHFYDSTNMTRVNSPSNENEEVSS